MPDRVRNDTYEVWLGRPAIGYSPKSLYTRTPGPVRC